MSIQGMSFRKSMARFLGGCDGCCGFGLGQELEAEVSDFAKIESLKGGNVLGHGAEDVFDRMQRVGLPGGAEEVAQDFPVIPALSSRFQSLVQTLEAAMDVDHRAPFFGESCAG